MNSAGPNDPSSWNRYAYTRGDPVNRIDTSGTDDCDPDEAALFGCLPPVITVPDIDFDVNVEAQINAALSGISAQFGQLAQQLQSIDPDAIDAWALTQGSTAQFSSESLVSSGSTPQGDVFQVGINADQYLALVGNGLIAANPAVWQEIEQGATGIINIVGSTVTAIAAWFAMNNSAIWHGGSFPTVQEIQTKCTPVGAPVVVSSTRRGNRGGGQSIEQQYKCPDGSTWTIHTVVDANGNVVLDPHPRPGSPRYGGGPWTGPVKP